MRVPATDLANVRDPITFQSKVSEVIRAIVDAINGNLTFGDNVRCKILEVDMTANQNTQVEHGLGRVPQGYIHCGASAGCALYNGTNENTDTHLFVRSDSTAKVKILVF